MQIINPANGEIIIDIREDDAGTLLQKFTLLKKTQLVWAARPLKQRIDILRQFSEAMTAQSETLAVVLTSEVGKPLQQSRNEINGAVSRIIWMTGHAEKYLGDEQMSGTDVMEEKISYDPLGVICNISAWNYPWLVGVNVFVNALLAGNAVMYKPSEYSTLTGLEIQKLLSQAGLPDGVFEVAVGKGPVGELLLELPFNGYFFTGSYKTGKYIYEKVAHKMVTCQLEMGGKDPLYVADDIVDIRQVAAGTADGAFYNNGQSCCSVERIYVHEAVYDRYLEEFVKEVASWKSGSPLEEGIYFGPLTRSEQLNVLDQQVADALEKGAHILLGGKRKAGRGNYYEPTIITEVNHDMLLMKDESFGPVIGIMKVKNDTEAIQYMNDTAYGLTAAVYSADQQRAQDILRNLNTGTGYWNCCDRVSASLPWSGRNHSGFGVALSHAGMRSFVKPKAWHMKNS